MLSRYSLFTLSKISTPSCLKLDGKPPVCFPDYPVAWPANRSCAAAPRSSYALAGFGGQPPLLAQRRLVEVNGIEPMTSCLQSRRSPN
jgi:hypothetical protein